MIFNTYQEEKPVRRYPPEFVEVQIRIPKWIMTQMIEEALRYP